MSNFNKNILFSRDQLEEVYSLLNSSLDLITEEEKKTEGDEMSEYGEKLFMKIHTAFWKLADVQTAHTLSEVDRIHALRVSNSSTEPKK